jgi:outer membrane protein assembly factor BamB
MHLEPPVPRIPLRPAQSNLRRLLLPESQRELELPNVADLTACVTSLARGVRRKALMSLPSRPLEFALVRHGEHVLVSCYGTDSAPEVHVWNRRVSLRALLDACAHASMEGARYDGDPDARRLAVRLAERALHTEFAQAAEPGNREVTLQGGSHEADESVPLAFGFSATLREDGPSTADRSLRADVHALLFDGVLWGFVRGRRVVLARGPILLAVQRMVHAVRAMVDAWEGGRPAHVRLRAGGFGVAVRLDRHGEVSLTFSTADGDGVTATALEVPAAALPILRMTSELLRTVVATDRSQSRNLRVRALRAEVRDLRRAIRARRRVRGFVNQDPDRLRVGGDVPAEAAPVRSTTPTPSPRAGSLRFSERWRFEVDGLSATSVFLCGDRIVIATPRHTAALCRDRGELLWARDGAGTVGCMAGTVLLRTAPDGRVELCDVQDGEPFAHARVAPMGHTPREPLVVQDPTLPPVAILAESERRLVAIDLRTGELRWRFSPPGDGRVRVRHAGRVLIATCGEGAITALDVASGETVWRFGEAPRFDTRPAICGEVVLAAGGDPGAAGTLYGIDLYSGRPRWSAELPMAPTADPVAAGDRVLVPLGRELGAHSVEDGSRLWRTEDPGLSQGGSHLVIDGSVVVNAPAGRLASVDLHDGTSRWQHALSHPVTDDVPRRLDPILRGGALFVPATSVHVVRPSDGAPLGDPLPCDLVPDLLRIDERCWAYVAEESGQLAALAPAPRLTLLKGGAG